MSKTNGAGKNIVLCLDGTGNRFAEHNTNVVKLFRVLERQPGKQVAYYDPGVGTLADPAFVSPLGKQASRAFGLAFGRGLMGKIAEAYTYLMARYRPGDRVYLFGFSRGAYTARALAAFVHRCGLLEPGAENLIPYALELFKRADFRTAGRFKNTYACPCEVHFLGLWDTVSTIGWVWNPRSLPNTRKNPAVRVVRHALAIDERRAYFRQNLWAAAEDARQAERQDVREVWFPGVHADVGGGYPEAESGLAKLALRWMVDEARQAGLVCADAAREQIVQGGGRSYAAPSAVAGMHRSLRSWWRIAEVLPKNVWHTRLGRRRWQIPRAAARFIADGSILHPSVLERMQADPDYRPKNLPPPEELDARFRIEA